MRPNILTIAGSDSGGGAGIQADIKTIMALGGYGMTVITALTAQNGREVAGIHAPPPEFVALQFATILDGFNISAAKTGMLFSAEIIRAIHPFLQKRTWPLVVDPVCASQSGNRLLEESAIFALTEFVIPGCDLLTPNIPETEILSGIAVDGPETALAASETLEKLGANAVLIKGGHLPGNIMVNDFLHIPGRELKILPQARVETKNNHGTGCTLSAAIATALGKGIPLEVAVTTAQKYLNLALRKSYNPGKGAGPVNHAAGLNIV